MSVTIWRYKIDKPRDVLPLPPDGIEQSRKARVRLEGWDHKTEITVDFTSQDSDEYIVSKAASKSGFEWKWPWWKRSANRKLAYLKKNRKQLFLEEEV